MPPNSHGPAADLPNTDTDTGARLGGQEIPPESSRRVLVIAARGDLFGPLRWAGIAIIRHSPASGLLVTLPLGERRPGPGYQLGGALLLPQYPVLESGLGDVAAPLRDDSPRRCVTETPQGGHKHRLVRFHDGQEAVDAAGHIRLILRPEELASGGERPEPSFRAVLRFCGSAIQGGELGRCTGAPLSDSRLGSPLRALGGGLRHWRDYRPCSWCPWPCWGRRWGRYRCLATGRGRHRARCCRRLPARLGCLTLLTVPGSAACIQGLPLLPRPSHFVPGAYSGIGTMSRD